MQKKTATRRSKVTLSNFMELTHLMSVFACLSVLLAQLPVVFWRIDKYDKWVFECPIKHKIHTIWVLNSYVIQFIRLKPQANKSTLIPAKI